MKLWICKTRKITCRLLRVRTSSEIFIMTVVANALALLVNLPPHGSRRMTRSLSEAQGKTLQKSGLTVQDKAKAEYEERSHHAEERKQSKPTLWFNLSFSKAHKLRDATVISGTLDSAKEHHLMLTDDKMRNDKDGHGQDR